MPSLTCFQQIILYNRITMKELLEEIISTLKQGSNLDPAALASLIRRHNRALHDVKAHHSKKKALAFYLEQKTQGTSLWESWAIDPELDRRIMKTLQMKPRRTASGVATITVITKPAPCAHNCLYCPNDIRMPKSYLSDEPACQRAERCFFDPYLQVAARLKALVEMGHETDKVELIVLGGTWSDYPESYQLWFITELFRALNDGDEIFVQALKRRKAYKDWGMLDDPGDLAQAAQPIQDEINRARMSYNQGVAQRYGDDCAWHTANQIQHATIEDLNRQQELNESAPRRVVGLVIETRPDALTVERLAFIRRLGCTKVQMGIQSLDDVILARNGRVCTPELLSRTFILLRAFGFKIHVHYMLNLLGSTPAADLQGYRRLVAAPEYQPDEIKLYPCVLVEGTGLQRHHADGSWKPYDEEALVDLLAECVLETPSHTRISRMIRDISAHDIKAGSKKTNLRQRVENAVHESGKPVNEIRLREISTGEVDVSSLQLKETRYDTAVSDERFLQFVTPENRIAGFLRLSLPGEEPIKALREKHPQSFPLTSGEAMIREVHVYGRAARLHDKGVGAQHAGLGKQLIERACEIARTEGYTRVNVISSVGTRVYYRSLGFEDNGLYQQRKLEE